MVGSLHQQADGVGLWLACIDKRSTTFNTHISHVCYLCKHTPSCQV